MPELRRNFSQAKMNKDMDERLVPPGQYRDAKNIQIATSDGSEVGTAQTLLGNTKYNTMRSSAGYYGVPDTSTCVGSIAIPNIDKIYYFVSAGDTSGSSSNPALRKDYILEFDTIRQTHKYVFVDIFEVNTTTSTANGSDQAYINVDAPSTINNTGIRIGMTVSGTIDGVSYNDSSGLKVSDIIFNDTADDDWKIYLEKDGVAFSDQSAADVSLVFKAPRVLNFSKDRLITAINFLDGCLYWTDNHGEPKKINIERSIKGTGGTTYLKGGGNAGYASANINLTKIPFTGDTDYFHTRLVRDLSFAPQTQAGGGAVMMASDLEVVTRSDKKRAVYVDESHITVIKRSPMQPLDLEMHRSAIPRVNTNTGVENPLYTQHNNLSLYADDGELYSVGSSLSSITFESQVDFRVGDHIRMVRKNSTDEGNTDFETFDALAEVTASNVTNPNNISSSGFGLKLLFVSSSIRTVDTKWYLRLDSGDEFFKFKFPRFSYRYKYQDGEYSTFAPWSEIAFLPDNYEYLPKKGYNLGMVNQLRSLKIKGYYPQELNIPQDVVAVDLLYKETNNPTVYIVKTITSSDDTPMWPDLSQDADARGEYTLDTDMIHAVVPANQLLRPWDNVPRVAAAQEISANRLIYGNYLQNFDVRREPIINVGYESTALKDTNTNYAPPSVKTQRIYQLGVVFSDKYGRETPVMTSESSTVEVPKACSALRNRISVSLLSKNLEIPSWAEYYSFYIKEPTVEYYNLSLDRWYHAEDGNMWLSFPSSERNKLDEETFLTVKKRHGISNNASGLDRRYKVLAIESEVPDDVKTVKKELGELFNGTSYSQFAIGNQTNGWPQMGATFITVDTTDFEQVYGDLTTMTPDSLHLRFYGGWQGAQRSNKYNVVKISKDTDHYTLRIDGYFGQDVEWIAGSSQSYEMTVSNLSMKLFEHKPEPRPEFNGRFFVKIYNDEELEEYLTSPAGETQYYIKAAWGLRYVNNNGYGNAGISESTYGGAHGQTPVDASELNTTGQNLSNFGVDYDQNNNLNFAEHPTEYSWGGLDNYNSSDHGTYYWGGGGSNSNDDNANGVSASQLDNKPVRHISGTDPKTQDFWDFMAGTEDFFIDNATAWSWTAESDDYPGSDYCTDVWSTTNDGGNAEDASASDEVSPPFGDMDHLTGNMLNERGQPSRGIWNNGKHMDISWTGMANGYDGGGSLSGTLDDIGMSYIPHQLQDIPLDQGGVYTAAALFIDKLVKPGAKFRFGADPDRVVYTVSDFKNFDNPDGINIGYNAIDTIYYPGTNKYTGAWGIRNYGHGNNKDQFRGSNLRQRWTLVVDPPIGSVGCGYSPTTGTNPTIVNDADSSDFRRAVRHDGTNETQIHLLAVEDDNSSDNFTDNPAVLETEPKESADIDIYYQASELIPLYLSERTNEEYIPIGSTFEQFGAVQGSQTKTVTGWSSGDTITFTSAISSSPLLVIPSNGDTITFTKPNGRTVTAKLNATLTGGETSMKLHGAKGATTNPTQMLITQSHVLNWNNCWSFGNGVESDRIRDDFNAPQMDNGVKASTVLETSIRSERRRHGLIWSGIYNSMSGINNTNQFIQAEKITKDLNPVYGSIQKLYNRNTRLIMFCEDKVLRGVTNRDALYNADGQPQLVASNAVVGDVQPYQGNFGIGKNPESFVATPYQAYFADALRGNVLAISGEGIRSISDIGMKDYFSDITKADIDTMLGTYDVRKNEYNLTIKKKYSPDQLTPHETATISYSESAKGWTSFKSFIPESGVSLNDNYYTFYNGHIWKHHENETRNNFYGTQYESWVTILFNDTPESIKSFQTINYEGTQSKIINFDTESTSSWLTGNYSSGDGLTTNSSVTDGEYYNLGGAGADSTAANGWYVDTITTNLQTGSVIDFKEKEGKWFGQVHGDATALSNLDLNEFSVQGLGTASIAHSTPSLEETITFPVKNNTGSTWDSTPD